MMIKDYCPFLIALTGEWTLRYHILIYLLYLVASCDAVVDDNCTSGHFSDGVSPNKVERFHEVRFARNILGTLFM